MPLKAPTWNEGVPALSPETPGPVFGHLDTSGAERDIRSFERGIDTATRGLETMDAVVQKAEDQASAALGLNASVEYARQLNAQIATFKGLKGMDAVKAQASASQKLYELRTKLGGDLPNKLAQEHFLQRTADDAVNTDRVLQEHASREYYDWQSGSIEGRKAELLTRLKLVSGSNSGAREATIDALADLGSEAAGHAGLSDGPSVRKERNVYAAQGLKVILDELVAQKDSDRIEGMLANLGEKAEGGKEVLATLKVMHPDTVAAAEHFVIQNRIAGVNEGALKVARRVGEDPLTHEKFIYPENSFDLNKAYAALAVARKDGRLRNDLELEEARLKLHAQAEVLQTARNDDLLASSADVYRVYDRVYAESGSAASAANEALKGAGLAAFTRLIKFAPETAYAIQRRLEERTYVARQRGKAEGPTDSEMLAHLAFGDRVRNNPGYLTTMTDNEFVTQMGAIGNDTYKNYWIRQRQQGQVDIAKGKVNAPHLDLILDRVARSKFGSIFDPNLPQLSWDGKAKQRYLDAQLALFDWAANEARRTGAPPEGPEIERQAYLFLSTYRPKSNTGWGRRPQLLGGGHNVTLRQGQREYGEDLANQLVLTEDQAKARDEWIRARMESIRRVNDPETQKAKKTHPSTQGFTQWVQERAGREWISTLNRAPGLNFTVPAEGGGLANPGMPQTAVDEVNSAAFGGGIPASDMDAGMD